MARVYLIIILASNFLLANGQTLIGQQLKTLDSLRLAGKVDTVSTQLPALLSQAATRLDSVKVQILLAKVQLDQKDYAAVLSTLAAAEAPLIRPADDLLVAAIYNVRGEWAFSQDQIQEAEDHHTKALGIRETYLGRDDERVADSYNNLGNVYYKKQDYQTAILQHIQALGIREVVLQAEHPKLASSYNNLAACYYENGQYEKAISYNEQALNIRLQSYGAFHTTVADSYNNLGNCYFAINDIAQAIEQHEGALRIRNQIQDLEGKAYALNNLGNCYLQIGDYKTAIPYFQESLTILNRIFQDNNLTIADVAANMSSALLEVGDARAALERADLALLVLENNLGEAAPNLIPVLINRGVALSRLSQYQNANRNLERAIQLLELHFDPQHPLLATCFNNLGNNYFQQNQQSLAQENYQKALNLYRQMGSYTKKEQASCLLNLGNCAQLEAQFTTALRWYDEASSLFESFQSSPSIQINIALNKAKALQAQNQAAQAIVLLENLLARINSHELPLSENQVDVYHTLGDLKLAQKAYDQSLIAFEKGIESLAALSQRFQGQSAKVNLRSRFYDLYEKAIAASSALYQQSKDKKYLEKAFQIAEKSKALLIREAQQKMQANAFAGLPDSILQKEQQLLETISEYEKIRYEELDLLDSLTLRQLDLELLKLKQDFAQLTSFIEEQFKGYYQLKYAEINIDIDGLQENLSQQNASLLSYFMGDSTVYIFVLDAQQMDLLEVPKGDLDRQIIQLWDAVTNMTAAQVAIDYESYAQTYASNAFQLYEQLIGNVQKSRPLQERLVLIPDGMTCYLPFDLLTTSPIDSTQIYSYHQYDYLLQSHSMSYAYSAKLWMQASELDQEKTKVSFYAFAPSFPRGASQLSPLYYNIPEVQQLAKLFSPSKLFIGADATLEQFKNIPNRSAILHLATHGSANAMASDFSYLAFSPLDSNAAYLYTKDIYALPLDPIQMVVLSACETGLGEAQPGEGIISLAHAFSFAGAKSIVTTLWSIDDEKTSQIMATFYKNLKEGQPKDQALRNAKIQYLQSHKGEAAHPYFWAAFVPIGEMDALTFSHFTIEWWWVLLALIVFWSARGLISSSKR